MTDKDMLIAAAKAAGIRTHLQEETNTFWVYGPRTWNPLTYDGDALRLAVKLGLDIDVGSKRVTVIWQIDGAPHELTQEITGDPYAATRRAIVRAAAEIGKAMK